MLSEKRPEGPNLCFSENRIMTPDFVTGFFFDAIKTAMLLAAPMLLTGLTVGLLVSIFQTATSINEMTLTFIPKMLGVGVALIFFFPWMVQTMIAYMENLYNNIHLYIR
jgi:flagellar biosynthetic protein FliQ